MTQDVPTAGHGRSADVTGGAARGEQGQGCLTRRNRHREDVCFCSSWMCLVEGWERLLSLVGREEAGGAGIKLLTSLD